MSDNPDQDRLDVLRSAQLLDPSPEPAFDRLTRLATVLLGAPVALITLIDEHRQIFKSALGLREPWASRRETPLSHSFCQVPTADRAPLVVNDARLHPVLRHNEALRDLDVVAYAGIPLIVGGAALGVLCAMDHEPRVWSDDDVRALQDLAASVVTEIELRRAAVALRQREQLQRAIVQNLPNGAIFMIDRELRYVTADGPAVAGLLNRAHLQGVVGQLVTDVVTPGNRDEVVAAYRAALAGESRRIELCRDDHFYDMNIVPLHDGAAVSHALALLYDVTGRKAELAELERARSALEQHATELRQLSLTDELTGLLNRRGFTFLAEQAIRVATRSKQKLVLVFIDLNGMKTINDAFGHEMGDRALVETASLLRRVFRRSDVIARLGGDEFVVLATHTTAGGLVFDQRVQEALAEYNASARHFKLSVSLGTSLFDPADPRSLEKLLSEADARMYEAKRNLAVTAYVRPY